MTHGRVLSRATTEMICICWPRVCVSAAEPLKTSTSKIDVSTSDYVNDTRQQTISTFFQINKYFLFHALRDLVHRILSLSFSRFFSLAARHHHQGRWRRSASPSKVESTFTVQSSSKRPHHQDSPSTSRLPQPITQKPTLSTSTPRPFVSFFLKLRFILISQLLRKWKWE